MTFSKLAAALLTLALAAPVSAEDFTGSGVHPFTSDSGCPIGARGDDEAMMCNRVALDDNFVSASRYAKQHTLHFSNLPGAPAAKRIAGDVVLHGTAKAQNGKTVPVNLLIKLVVTNGRWLAEAQGQAPVEGPLSALRMDPYHITVTEGGATRMLFTPEQAQKAMAAPSLALAAQGMQLHDNRAGKPQAAKVKLADMTVLVGAGKTAQPMLRARLEVKGSHKVADMPGTLLRGDWSLELEPLDAPVPLDVIRRELFLTGLEAEPLLTPLRVKGFKKGSKLVVGVQGLRGFVRFDGKEIEFDRAARAGHIFLRDNFLGLALTWRVTQP